MSSLHPLRFLLAALALGMASSSAVAQDEADWFCQSWQTEDGLPDNEIRCIAQANDGYLWLATRRGLVRFDGVQFKVFTPANLPGLPHSQIHSLLVDETGVLWIAAGVGHLGYLRPGSATVETRADNISLDPLSMLAQDGAGNIWGSPWSDLLFRIDREKVDELPRRGAPTWKNHLFSDASGKIWDSYGNELIAPEGRELRRILELENPIYAAPRIAGGLWVMEGAELRQYVDGHLSGTFAELPLVSTITAMLEDADGGVWVGTANAGLWRYNNGAFAKVEASHSQIVCLCQDRERNVWIGTGGGGLNKARHRVAQLVNRAAGLAEDVVLSVSESPARGIVFTTSGGAVYGWKPAEKMTLLRAANSETPATCALSTRDGALWFGTAGAGLVRIQDGVEQRYTRTDPRHLAPSEWAFCLLEDAEGILWVGSQDGVAYFQAEAFHPLVQPQLRKEGVRCMALDGRGALWVGGGAGSLFCWDHREWRQFSKSDGLPGAPLRQLVFTPDGDLWITTFGDGLLRYRQGVFSLCRSRDGLWDDAITQLMADDEGRFWCGSPRGFFSVRQSDLNDFFEHKRPEVECTPYGRTDGLPNIRAAGELEPRAWKTQDGRLLFATFQGLAVISPAEIRTNALPPPVSIESLAIDGREMTAPPRRLPLEAPAGATRYDFAYAALSFAAPDKMLFRHRIVGLDGGWSAPTKDRRATYFRLPPGAYEFQVIASNNDGVWNRSGATLRFATLPTFWQRKSVRAGSLLLFSLALVFLVRYISFRRLQHTLAQARQTAAIEKERARIAQDMHDELGSVLTRIAFLGDLAQEDRHEPAMVEEHVTKMAASARRAVDSLDEIVWAVNPRNDTVAHFVEYAGKYAAEYLSSTETRFQLNLQSPARERRLSSDARHHLFLCFKEALHNVVKHARATEVRIAMREDAGALVIRVSDDGVGFAEAPENAYSDGLRNMRERMAAIDGSFRIESRPGGGTQVELCLPLEKRPT